MRFFCVFLKKDKPTNEEVGMTKLTLATFTSLLFSVSAQAQQTLVSEPVYVDGNGSLVCVLHNVGSATLTGRVQTYLSRLAPTPCTLEPGEICHRQIHSNALTYCLFEVDTSKQKNFRATATVVVDNIATLRVPVESSGFPID